MRDEDMTARTANYSNSYETIDSKLTATPSTVPRIMPSPPPSPTTRTPPPPTSHPPSSPTSPHRCETDEDQFINSVLSGSKDDAEDEITTLFSPNTSEAKKVADAVSATPTPPGSTSNSNSNRGLVSRRGGRIASPASRSTPRRNKTTPETSEVPSLCSSESTLQISSSSSSGSHHSPPQKPSSSVTKGTFSPLKQEAKTKPASITVDGPCETSPLHVEDENKVPESTKPEVFSPTPHKTDSRARGNSGKFSSLSFQDPKLHSPCALFLSPYSPSRLGMLSSPLPKDIQDYSAFQMSPALKSDRGNMTTPTNFGELATGEKSPGGDSSNLGFSWLNSPQCIFPPTPKGSTPTKQLSDSTPSNSTPVSSSFFLQDASKKKLSNHPYSNMICISPLASSKKSRTRSPFKGRERGNSVDFHDFFASPKKGFDFGSEIGMAERDLMEDEDLTVLLQLASTSNNNPGQSSAGGSTTILRSPVTPHRPFPQPTPPSSLHLPLMNEPKSHYQNTLPPRPQSQPRRSFSETHVANPEPSFTECPKKNKKRRNIVLQKPGFFEDRTHHPPPVMGQGGSLRGVLGAPRMTTYPNGMTHFPHHPGNPVEPKFLHPGAPINPYNYPPPLTTSHYPPQPQQPPSKKSSKKHPANAKPKHKPKKPQRPKKHKPRPTPSVITPSKNAHAAALAAAILRGVTMRPSGKWQAQLYYAGKSRYIGVFDTREKAALAYEIAREKLKSDKAPEVQGVEDTERAVSSARKAAFEGVNEPDPRPLHKR